MDDDLVARAETLVDADRDTVWQTLTDPDLVAASLPGTTVSSTWEEGAGITWEGTWEGRTFRDHGTVLEIEPGHRLKVTHTAGTAEGDDPHVVTYDLADGEDGFTRLVVTQENNADAATVQQSELMWKQMLQGVKDVAERQQGSRS